MPKDEKEKTTEGVEVAEEATEAAATTEATEDEKAPWEKEGEEFDPARAWQLIQNLRAENTKLKEKAAATPTPEKQEEQPAPEEPAENPAQEQVEPAPATETKDESDELTAAKLENTKLRALAAAGLDLELIDLVPGTDAESIAANIEKLKALSGAGGGKKNFPVNPAQGEKPATNPKEDWAKAIFG